MQINIKTNDEEETCGMQAATEEKRREDWVVGDVSCGVIEADKRQVYAVRFTMQMI